MHRAAVVSSTLAPVALIGGWTVAEWRQPAGYDAVHDTISALAAHSAHDRWIMTSALLVLGLCHLVTAASLTDATPAGRLLLASGGLATIGVAAAAQPSAVHTPVATFAFIVLAVWPIAAKLPTPRIALSTTVVLLVLLGWLATELHGELLGLSERCVAGSQAVWPAVVVLSIMRRRRRATAVSEPIAPAISDPSAVRVVEHPVERTGPEPRPPGDTGLGKRP